MQPLHRAYFRHLCRSCLSSAVATSREAGNSRQSAQLLVILGCAAACTSIPPPYIVEPAEPVPSAAIVEPLAHSASFHNDPQFVFTHYSGLTFDDQTEVLAAALTDAGIVTSISLSRVDDMPLRLVYRITIADSDYGDTSPEAVQFATLGLSGMAATWFQWFEFDAIMTIFNCEQLVRSYEARTRVESRFRPGFRGFSPEEGHRWQKEIIDLGGKDLAAKLVRQFVDDVPSVRDQIARAGNCEGQRRNGD